MTFGPKGSVEGGLNSQLTCGKHEMIITLHFSFSFWNGGDASIVVVDSVFSRNKSLENKKENSKISCRGTSREGDRE